MLRLLLPFVAIVGVSCKYNPPPQDTYECVVISAGAHCFPLFHTGFDYRMDHEEMIGGVFIPKGDYHKWRKWYEDLREHHPEMPPLTSP